MRFVFLFIFHQLVDAGWRKFANSASKVIMMRCSRKEGYRKIYSFRYKAQSGN